MRQMALQRRARLVLSGAIVAMGLALPGHARDVFDEIYQRGKPLEQSLTTIRAHFTEETTSSLLTRPLVAEGTLIVVRPSDILLTYTKPERKTLRLDGQHLLFVWPDRGLRERKDIREAQGRVQKYFVNKTPEELRKHFTIVAADDKSRPGTWHIDMVPTRKQIQQGLSRLELWVRQDSMTLSAMRMTFPGGDTKTMTFTDVVLNQPVSPQELNPRDQNPK
jgi:outer membrane lipoprotein-sorting protein